MFGPGRQYLVQRLGKLIKWAYPVSKWGDRSVQNGEVSDFLGEAAGVRVVATRLEVNHRSRSAGEFWWVSERAFAFRDVIGSARVQRGSSHRPRPELSWWTWIIASMVTGARVFISSCGVCHAVAEERVLGIAAEGGGDCHRS